MKYLRNRLQIKPALDEWIKNRVSIKSNSPCKAITYCGASCQNFGVWRATYWQVFNRIGVLQTIMREIR